MTRERKVVRARKRFAANRRRREARDKVALDWEFASLVRRIPQPIMMAIFKAVTEERPDAFAPLPSPWRERALAAWQESVEAWAERVVTFRPPAGPTSVVS
jgi:hypothetical protein